MGDKIHCGEFGGVVMETWKHVPVHFPSVKVDEFVIMPNHIHGIIMLTEPVGAGFPRPLSVDGETSLPREGAETAPLRRPKLGQVVGYFKYQATKRINALRRTPGLPVWQRNYYEHVIRNEDELRDECKNHRFNHVG